MESIICNPLNLEYRYQIKKSILNTAVYRESADPTLIVWKDKYLLFASMTGGFWYSTDLVHWIYKSTPELPIYDYAPDVHVVNNAIVFSASKRGEKCKIYKSHDPINESFHEISQPLSFWDPNIFQDDDGSVFLYWGCDTRQPIWGIQLDQTTMLPISKKVAIVKADDKIHGWERVGDNNKIGRAKSFGERLIRLALGTKPCTEGAFMTKHNGKYYFQYATPWTQNNVYSDGVYIADSPLGPFVYQKHNPFSSKPGGFITAAGHGSTFQDLNGKWWHVSTMRISVNDDYERRIGLFPCDFDEDGILYCNQNFADYPFDLNRDDRMTKDPDWMLLSYNANIEVSSYQLGYEGSKSADEDIRTYWAAKTGSQEEWLKMDLGSEKNVKAIQINFFDHNLDVPNIAKSEMHKDNIGYRKLVLEKQRTRYILECSCDNISWQELKNTKFDEFDYTHELIVLPDFMKIRYLRLSQMELAMGGVIAISGLRVFGQGDGERPDKVEIISAKKRGSINLVLNWKPSKHAMGYNIRYGIAQNKLYSSWQIYNETELDLGMINVNTDYYCRIDSFNENGITNGDIVCIPFKGEKQ